MFSCQNKEFNYSSVIKSTFNVTQVSSPEDSYVKNERNAQTPVLCDESVMCNYKQNLTPTPNVPQFEAQQNNGWYSPQQFVPSSSFPYFGNSTHQHLSPMQIAYKQNMMPIPHPQNGYPNYNYMDNYIPNSCPSLEQLIQNAPVPQGNVNQQHLSQVGNQYVVKATMSYSQVPQNQKQKKCKRIRTAFTTEQIIVLEEVYVRQLYVSKIEREALTERLGLSDRAIKVWFQNRRMKGKRDLQDSFESSDSSPAAVFEDIETQMQQCEVVNDYVSVPTELCDKLGELINQYVPREFIDNGINSSNSVMESSVSTVDSSSSMQDEGFISTDFSNSTVSVEPKSSPNAAEEHSLDIMEQYEYFENSLSKYEPISPAEGLPIELPTWKPQDAKEMKSLFDKHFC